jgi:hypothetical protein
MPSPTVNPEPHWGFTRRHQFPVHADTLDHHPGDTPYQRFNKHVATWLTKNVGTMTTFWVFWLLCLFILPSCLALMGAIHTTLFVATFGFNLLATWLLSTCLELTLMPAIMTGQNLQNAAADARSAKQFEDTELIRGDVSTTRTDMIVALDRLDTTTEGGIKEILDAIHALTQALG